MMLFSSTNQRKEYDLVLESNDFYGGYHVSVDPSIANSFATAALRYGHSAVGNFYKPCTPTADFHNPAPLYAENGVDAILRGLLNQPAREVDRYCIAYVEGGVKDCYVRSTFLAEEPRAPPPKNRRACPLILLATEAGHHFFFMLK